MEKEITSEEAKRMVNCCLVNKGGIPNWMFDEHFDSVVDLFNRRSEITGVRLAYMKIEIMKGNKNEI